jgi:VanZ family protein
MLRSLLLRRLALSITLLAIGNLIGTLLHWYSLVWWLDMPAHFLGGMAVFYLSAVFLLPYLKKGMSGRRFVFLGVLIGFVLGVVWEGFQLFLYHYSGGSQPIPLDVLSDLCFDLAGSLIASLTVIRYFTSHNETR